MPENSFKSGLEIKSNESLLNRIWEMTVDDVFKEVKENPNLLLEDFENNPENFQQAMAFFLKAGNGGFLANTKQIYEIMENSTETDPGMVFALLRLFFEHGQARAICRNSRSADIFENLLKTSSERTASLLNKMEGAMQRPKEQKTFAGVMNPFIEKFRTGILNVHEMTTQPLGKRIQKGFDSIVTEKTKKSLK